MLRKLAVVFLVCSCSGLASGGPIYVDASATGAEDGCTWATAYDEIQEAIAGPSTQCGQPGWAGAEIWVATGIYSPISIDAYHNGVAIIGGFVGGETSADEADPAANPTFISGGYGARAVDGINNDSATELRGLHIVFGAAAVTEFGSGMRLSNSALRCRRCVFTGNGLNGIGGALAVLGGTPLFEDCDFVGNNGSWAGSAVYVAQPASPKFVNCLFRGNSAMQGGAVLNATRGPTTFVNCTFAGNDATVRSGGAISDSAGTTVLRNCVLWGNTSVEAGTEAIGYAAYSQAPDVTYSVVQDDDPNDDIIFPCTSSPCTPGAGNIDDDPLFVRNPSDGGDGWGVGGNDDYGDLHLQSSSPCLDVGDNDDVDGYECTTDGECVAAGYTTCDTQAGICVGSAIDFDFDGEVRIFDSDANGSAIVDMGPYELVVDCNDNGIHDDKDLADCTTETWCDDCNTTGVIDVCDISSGTSQDCDSNGIPDECSPPPADGACCLPDPEGCTDTTEQCCAALGGLWRGAFGTCATLPRMRRCPSQQ